MKAAASSFIICSLLGNHTSYASSRQAPALFGMKRSSKATVTATDTAASTRQRYTSSEDYTESHIFVRKAKNKAGLKNKRRNQEIAIDGGRGIHKESHNQEFVTSSSHGSGAKGPLSSQLNQNYTHGRGAAAAAAAASTREKKASKIKSSATSIESKTSRLIQIPLALTLQHASDAHDVVPIATFLDTGAQVTVMTYDAAKRAGIAHLIDTRYAGHASGVAGVSCRVLGRIPANSVSFILGGDDDQVVDASPAITVLEDRIMNGEAVDMLLGLDVLEEWQAMVCLRDRTLTIRNGCRRLDNRELVIPFLGSSKSKSSSKSTRNQERYTPPASSSSSYSYGSSSNTSSSTPSSRYSSSGKGYRNSKQLYGQKGRNPFARDSSLLESELDALDQRSKTSSEGTPITNVSSYTSTHLNGFEEVDDDGMDDDSDSNYFESEDDYDGCDLSGL